MNSEVYEGLTGGERRLVDWHFGHSGSFFKSLFDLMARADTNNLPKLALGFPEEAAALDSYKTDPVWWPNLCERLGVGP